MSKKAQPHNPKRHHIDKRAASLKAAAPGGDDELLDTLQLASWLQVSVQWLEIGRSKNYGPPYERLSPTLIRYRRGAVRAWLVEREYASTEQYGKSRRARAASAEA
jgi:hypothetical protein